ncbi:MAG TPA: hypothetical protein VFN06_03955, partial [Gaiellaceae bacterium]|nr:hypothetical protein [Gaiellaceae bacterium]
DAFGDVGPGQKTPTVRGAKIEGWLRELGRCGVEPDWDHLVVELAEWRARRNAYAHELHLGGERGASDPPEQWDIESFVVLLTEALDALDRALAERES